MATAREWAPRGTRPWAWARAAWTRWVSRIALVSGPTPPGTGVIAEATRLAVSNSTSPDELAVHDVDADVHDDGTRLEHVAGHEVGAPDGHDHDVRAADHVGETLGLAVADGDRGVLAQEQERRGLADDVGPADDHGMLAADLDPAVLEDLDAGVGGRREEPVVPQREEARVERVDPVDVAERVQDVDHGPQADARRQRHLGDDPGHVGVGLELAQRAGDVGLAGVRGQLDQAVLDPDQAAAVEDLVEVDRRRRVLADHHDGERRRVAGLQLERLDVGGHLLADRRGDRAAAQEARPVVGGEGGHAGSTGSGLRDAPPRTCSRVREASRSTASAMPSVRS